MGRVEDDTADDESGTEDDDVDELTLLVRTQVRASARVLRLVDLVHPISERHGPVSRPELGPLLFDVADQLREHFDREQDGLFRFLERDHRQHVAAAVRLTSYQFEIRKVLGQLTDAVAKSDAVVASARPLLEQLEALYAEYWLVEKQLLLDLTRSFDAAERAKLDQLCGRRLPETRR